MGRYRILTKYLHFTGRDNLVEEFRSDLWLFLYNNPEFNGKADEILKKNNIEWSYQAVFEANTSYVDAECIIGLILFARAEGLDSYFKNGCMKRWLIRLEQLDHNTTIGFEFCSIGGGWLEMKIRFGHSFYYMDFNEEYDDPLPGMVRMYNALCRGKGSRWDSYTDNPIIFTTSFGQNKEHVKLHISVSDCNCGYLGDDITPNNIIEESEHSQFFGHIEGEQVFSVDYLKKEFERFFLALRSNRYYPRHYPCYGKRRELLKEEEIKIGLYKKYLDAEKETIPEFIQLQLERDADNTCVLTDEGQAYFEEYDYMMRTMLVPPDFKIYPIYDENVDVDAVKKDMEDSRKREWCIRAECIERLKIITIIDTCVKCFKEEGKVFISEDPHGYLYDLEKADEANLAYVESKIDGKVYLIMRTHTPYGVLDSFFYVESNVEEWAKERTNLRKGIADCCVINHAMGNFLEFGSVQFELGFGGTPIRKG